jgi:CHAT domain-containing protein
MRQYTKAEPLLERSLKIAEANDEPTDLDASDYLGGLADVCYAMGHYAKAEPLYERSLRIREAKLGADDVDVADSLYAIARMHQALGRYAKAEPLYQRSLKIHEAKLGPDHPGVARTLNGLAWLYVLTGQYAKAEPLYQRSLKILETKLGPDDLDVAETLHDYAWLFGGMGQYSKAKPFLERSLKIREAKLGSEHLDVAWSLNGLGSLYFAMKQYADAEPLYQRALRIVEARLGAEHPDVALSLNDLGLLYVEMDQNAKAQPLLERSLKTLEAKLGAEHPHVALSLLNLARLYGDMGQHAKAEPLAARGLEIYQARFERNHPDILWAQHIRACLYATSDRRDEAMRLMDRVLRSARIHSTQVLPLLSDAEQLAFLAETEQWYLSRGLSLVLEKVREENQYRSASWLLNGKSIAQQSLGERILLARDSGSARAGELLTELTSVRQELAKMALAATAPGKEDEVRKRRQELQDKEKELSGKLHLTDDRRRRDDSWIELDDMRGKLPAKGVYVDFAKFDVHDFKSDKPLPARYAAWITPKTGDVEIVDLGPAETIEAAIKEARQALEESAKTVRTVGEPEAEKALRGPLAALTKLILRPLRPHIDSAEHWVLCPDASLWLVPWAALPLDETARATIYAIEKHQIQYVVTGRDLVLSPLQLDLKNTAPVIFADPDFDQQAGPGSGASGDGSRSLSSGWKLGSVPPLPWTAAEAEAVRPRLEEYAGAQPTLLTQQQATARAFTQVKSPKVLIAATHGFFLADQELGPKARERQELPGNARPKALPGFEDPLLRCGLLLAGCNRQNSADTGVITGREILSTDLRGTELVVLSACETGLGDVRNGEGVAGLRQAFQLAGAQSVVATLWQIPDRDSALLMSDFFDHLAKGRGKAEALREAQLARIKARRQRNEAAHPIFWAAFTLTGR